MGLREERRQLQDELRQSARGGTGSDSRYRHVVDAARRYLEDDMAQAGAPGGATIENLRIEVVRYGEHGRAGREFTLRASGRSGTVGYTTLLTGTCDVRVTKLLPSTFEISPHSVEPDHADGIDGARNADEPDEAKFAAPHGDDLKQLERWTNTVAVGLVAMSVAGAAAMVGATIIVFDQTTTDVPEMLLLAGATGWVGSCLAALRSFIDRIGEGVEYDRHDTADDTVVGKVVRRAQWPERPDGTQRFNANVARGMLLRPLLGALTAPVAYFALFVVSSGFQVEVPPAEPDRDIGIVLIGVAGLAGLFAKTMLDNLNKATANLFRPHDRT